MGVLAFVTWSVIQASNFPDALVSAGVWDTPSSATMDHLSRPGLTHRESFDQKTATLPVIQIKMELVPNYRDTDPQDEPRTAENNGRKNNQTLKPIDAIPVSGKYILDEKMPTWKFPADVAPHQVVIVMCDNRWHPPPEYLVLSAAVNAAYAQHHGHRFLACDSTKDFSPNQVPPNLPHVGKLYCVLRAMTDMEDVRMVVYIDSDAIMRNFTQTFTKFIQTNVIPPTVPVPANLVPPDMNLLFGENYDIIVPTDCSDYKFNTGLQIWKNTPSAHQFLHLWIEYTLSHERFLRFAYEQLAFKLLFLAHDSHIAYRVATIPRGEDTWHTGICKKGPLKRVPNFLAHIPGKFRDYRITFMQQHIRELCVNITSPWAVPDMKDCDKLVKLLKD